MTENPSFWVVISILSPIIFGIIRYVSPIHRKFQLWCSKKTLNLISGIGLISTCIPMIILSVNADTQMFAVTGFILPFIHPSIHGLTFSQASIFGNFANFFYCTLIIGVLGALIGLSRIQKFHNLRNPPFMF